MSQWELCQQKTLHHKMKCQISDPTQTRTEIDRLGGGCPIQLCYGAKTIYYSLTNKIFSKEATNDGFYDYLVFPYFFVFVCDVYSFWASVGFLH